MGVNDSSRGRNLDTDPSGEGPCETQKIDGFNRGNKITGTV